MAYCTACGNRIEAPVLFCTECGARAGLAAQPWIATSEVARATPVVTGMAVAAQMLPATQAPLHLTQPPPAASTSKDFRLKVIASVSIVVSVVGWVAGLLGLVPSAVSTIVVLIGVSAGLRVAWSYAAKSASSPSQARAAKMASNVGLAISVISLIVAVPRITQTAGLGAFFADVTAQLWTMALLMAIALPVRTLGWRVFAGTGLTGFLAITSLARLVGRSMVVNLGSTSLLAVALWVPITEELLKLLPVALVLWVAMRRFQVRPSAMDVMLLGAWTGAGFNACESATLGRGHFSLTAPPLVSLAFPSEGSGMAYGWPLVQTGHLAHTALIALSIAIAVFYSRQTKRLTWLIPVAACGAVLLEHSSQNAIVLHGLDELVAKIAMVLSLGGYLTSLLLLAGTVFVLSLEWRIVGGEFTPVAWLRLRPEEGMRRARLLARAQTGGMA